MTVTHSLLNEIAYLYIYLLLHQVTLMMSKGRSNAVSHLLADPVNGMHYLMHQSQADLFMEKFTLDNKREIMPLLPDKINIKG